MRCHKAQQGPDPVPGNSASEPYRCSRGRNLGSLVPQCLGQPGRVQAGWVPGACHSSEGSSRNSHGHLPLHSAGPRWCESLEQRCRAWQGGLQQRGCDFIWAELTAQPHRRGLSQRHRQATRITHKICLQPPCHGFTPKKPQTIFAIAHCPKMV